MYSCFWTVEALASITQVPFEATTVSNPDEDDTPLPITSYACQWKVPRQRKETNARIADLQFEKHVFGRVRKHQLAPIDDFDPRPPQFHVKLQNHLPDFLEKVRGKGLGISSLCDPSTQVWSDSTSVASTVELPSKQNLVGT